MVISCDINSKWSSQLDNGILFNQKENEVLTTATMWMNLENNWIKRRHPNTGYF